MFDWKSFRVNDTRNDLSKNPPTVNQKEFVIYGL